MNLEQRTEGTISEETGCTSIQSINLRLALLGCPTFKTESVPPLPEIAGPLLSRQRETSRLLVNYLSPADWRLQNFLDEYLYETGVAVKLPSQTLVLDHAGLARDLSLPPNRDEFISDIVHSYRVRQGVLHNPKSDRRTTQGVFHVAEGGLPIPDDKVAVPKYGFARLLHHALTPPSSLLRLPFTSGQKEQAECFVSLLLRPLVCPAVPGFIKEKRMEIRFFAPGNLVSNLDFVESIFGNAGDPFLPGNDSALDVDHWTGHSGCVILAPHLVSITKKSLGLPAFDEASPRQRRDGMCWKNENELYNAGAAFKITCRDQGGVIVTIIADNYYGYCKKEVKTQISYSANLFGLCEEEHAGGALVYPSYDLGEKFSGELHVRQRGHSFNDLRSLCADAITFFPSGYGIDKKFPEITYVPEDARFDLQHQTISWSGSDGEQSIKLLARHVYVRPSGYRIRMQKPPGNRAWRLIGTVAEGTLCHKPCTVSGGGKSEISKPITDAFIHGPVFIADFIKDFDELEKLIGRDYSRRFRDETKNGTDTRAILDVKRSLGSVIKLLTPSSRDYSDSYNEWLASIPQYVKELLFVVKRFYRLEWGNTWREHFSVDVVNGTPGNELKCENRKLVSNYLRVGYEADGLWRVFGLRKDFYPAEKVQMEDDITASVVVPVAVLENVPGALPNYSVKFVQNCELRLFQRPDDAIHRGYDKQTEADLAKPGNFLSNYEPLSAADAQEFVEDAIGFEKFTEPMQKLILEASLGTRPVFFVSSAHPRLVDGVPSKNPRYLQHRPDLLSPCAAYLSEMCTRLHRGIPLGQPVHTPVTAVMPGRRNNPPDVVARIRPLAVYNPIHHMELPELFMEFICSMTGKSPSTTGAGSEGALTKGPFNALPPIIDLNAALVSYLLTGHDAFISAAGYVGPKMRVDHDVSLLVPEVWCRMSPKEREARSLITEGYLEKCEDFEFNGKTVRASRLGYRITARFVRTYFGRVFNHPHVVFTDAMLRPEIQDMEDFADGMDNIVGTQKRIAKIYMDDGSIEMACPPLKALLHIMAYDQYEGKPLGDPVIRALFSRQTMLSSQWYSARLLAKQAGDAALWNRHVLYLEHFLAKPNYLDESERLGIKDRLQSAWATLRRAQSPDYLKELQGTLGTQPL